MRWEIKMKHKKRLCVYPYDVEFSPILRHKELLSDYEIAALVSPKGWGLIGKDAATSDGGPLFDYIVSTDFQESLMLCDTVLFVEACYPIDLKSFLYPKIKSAIESKKNIICMLKLEEDDKKDLKERCEKAFVTFEYDQDDLQNNYKENIPKLFSINIPIVFVCGLSERSNKFHTLLSLKTNLTSLGYKVGMIGSRRYCEFMGFHSFPEFMLGTKHSESKKIILFNHFVKKIEIDEKPDIILIGIPGSIEAQNDILRNDFGILSYEIAAAVKPDAIVMNLQYNDYQPSYFELLNNLTTKRFGSEVTCFVIANIKFDYSNSDSFVNPQYITLPTAFIDQWLQRQQAEEVKLYNSMNAADSQKIVHQLIHKLSQ